MHSVTESLNCLSSFIRTFDQQEDARYTIIRPLLPTLESISKMDSTLAIRGLILDLDHFFHRYTPATYQKDLDPSFQRKTSRVMKFIQRPIDLIVSEVYTGIVFASIQQSIDPIVDYIDCEAPKQQKEEIATVYPGEDDIPVAQPIGRRHSVTTPATGVLDVIPVAKPGFSQKIRHWLQKRSSF